MKKYELQILRYYHDIVTGEFVNVGIVLFNKESGFLRCHVTHKYGRLSKFFHTEHTALAISQAIKLFETSIINISKELHGLFPGKYENIEAITSKVLPKDDSSLQCSEVIKGLSLDFEKTFSELYGRYIVRYEDNAKRTSRSDDEAWQQVYKKYFDEYGLTRKLSKHQIKTANDKFDFDYAFQNGTLHIYNPVSFDLMDHDSIRDKVYRWKGKISEIDTAKEDIQIHMLLLFPENQNKQEEKFITKVLSSAAAKQNLVLHNEKNLKTHLKELKEYIAEHE